jgi:hypothetical protein
MLVAHQAILSLLERVARAFVLLEQRVLTQTLAAFHPFLHNVLGHVNVLLSIVADPCGHREEVKWHLLAIKIA